MRSKVVAAEMATAAGIATVICNGMRAGRSRRCSRGEREGTRFPAGEARYSSFKLWLKYAKPSRGTLVIDAGAVRALRDGSASLLPVGVVEVSGEFDAGDAVEIAAAAAQDGPGRTLGKGICNYSADELRQVIGLKSEAVSEILPRATDEAIHRDYLVLDSAPELRARRAALLYAMATTVSSVADICAAAKRASRALAHIDTAVKDAALAAIARCARARVEEILDANERDMEAPAMRRSARRCSIGCAWTRSASRGSPRRSARSPRSATPSAR